MLWPIEAFFLAAYIHINIAEQDRMKARTDVHDLTERVLVAGATGYLGKFIVKELNGQEYWVRALSRNSRKIEPVNRIQRESLAIFQKLVDIAMKHFAR